MIYLDNAATTGKKPPEVLKAVQKELLLPANPGRSAHRLSLKSMNKIYETRDKQTDDVTYTFDTLEDALSYFFDIEE